MEFQPKPTTIPKNYPSWASWQSRQEYLPAEVHSSTSLKKALAIARNAFRDPAVFEAQAVDAPLLLLGLLSREVSRAIEVEPGEATEYPQHLINSPLGIQDMHQIE